MSENRSNRRKLPRKFKFPWGNGYVLQEASIVRQADGHKWEPTIQLLKYEGGGYMVRFCVYYGKKIGRMPLLMNEEDLPELARELAKNKELLLLLRELVDCTKVQ